MHSNSAKRQEQGAEEPDGKAAERAATGRTPALPAGLLTEVLERLPQGVVTFGPDGTVLLANRRYCEMFDMPPASLSNGTTLVDLFALRGDGTIDARARRVCDRLRESMLAGEVVAADYATRDGRTIHCINSPLPSGGWIVTHEDVTEQRAADRRIEHLANHDALTDLPNRTLFGRQLDAALAANPPGRQLAVMFVDLDHFKGVNDTLGHPVGDELIKAVALRLRGCLRTTDLVARFGGDEFVIVCPELADQDEAEGLAIRIREAVLPPYQLHGHQVVVDTSIGIALAPADGDTADGLVRNADLALYSAKQAGRGTHRFFEGEMNRRMTERRALELDLRGAFADAAFELHYQPLVNLAQDRISGCEALLRWRHPRRGMVSPTEFIPVAEEIGLIGRLGEWVINTACAEAARWPGDIAVAVNVSPVQFRNHDLVDVVARALAASGLSPQRLEIEITEAILLDQSETNMMLLRRLRALGVRIAMDDFGTGYSSLGYLQKFRFDKIKIDRAFISELGDDSESNAIVRAITGIADSFRMTTTAEGVETESQRRLAKALGCTEMQGYLYSPARPARDIARLLAKAAPTRTDPGRTDAARPGPNHPEASRAAA